ncbi:MAG: protein kinase [Candidatus Sumerlaeia bacterium]|nr:protein kinase [Candidatus Sumerlaeia bacterium]
MAGSGTPPPESDATVFDSAGLPGRVLDGRYEIQGVLGHGAMGTVYRAWQLRLRRPVAIKVPRTELLDHPEFAGRFEREALAMAKVVHENVVQIHDVHVATNRSEPSFLVMELVEGCTLDEYVDQNWDTLTVGRLMEVVAGVAAGLDAAHSLGIVHRDVKPGNIVVTQPRGIAKIMDFGIARADMDDVFATQDDIVVGTPAFMAPEQIRGGVITPAADIYALGMVTYRLLTGELPFEARSKADLLVAHVQDTPMPIHQRNAALPVPVWQALAPALAKQPALRPASASALVASVAQALAPIAQVTLADLTFGHNIPGQPSASAPGTEPTVALASAETIDLPKPESDAPASALAAARSRLATENEGALVATPRPPAAVPATLYPALPTVTATLVRPQPPAHSSRRTGAWIIGGGIVLASLILALAIVLPGMSKARTSVQPTLAPEPTAKPDVQLAPPPEEPRGQVPKSLEWLADPRWNIEVTPSTVGPEEAARTRQELQLFIDAHFVQPANRGDANFLADSPAQIEARRLLTMLDRARQDHNAVQLDLDVQETSMIWDDHAIAVASLRVSGIPKMAPGPTAPRHVLVDAPYALRLKMLREPSGWSLHDMALELGPNAARPMPPPRRAPATRPRP